MNIGIVGSSEGRFNPDTMKKAMDIIHKIIDDTKTTKVVSGHCPNGGVDIWAENYAKHTNKPTEIFTPEQNSWDGEYGYKARNIDIAMHSDILHVITIKNTKFHNSSTYCYHCNTDTHVRSGGCWTGKHAQKMGKKVIWHIIGEENE